MADAIDWLALDDSTLGPLERILPDEVYKALQEEIRRQRTEMPPASGLGMENLNSIPNNQEDAIEKALMLQRRYLAMGQLCFLFELGERESRKRCRILEKRNHVLEKQYREDQIQLRRLKQRIKTLLKIPDPPDEPEPNEPTEEVSPSTRAPKKRGAPKGHRGATRPIPNHVDFEEIRPPANTCPDCGTGNLQPGDTFDDVYIEDIPPVLRVVTRLRYRHGWCPCCQNTVHHPDALSGPPVRTGPRLAAHLAQLRAQLGVSYRKLALYCTELLHLSLTPSGALGILNRFSDRLEPLREAIEHVLPLQKVLHGDETGWKVDGVRWQMWCFCNASLALFHADKSRAAKVPLSLLGLDYAGLLHCDFHGAYNKFRNLQRCLIHWGRDVHNELKLSPDDPFLIQLHAHMKAFFEAAKQLKGREMADSEADAIHQTLNDLIKAIQALKPPEGPALTLVKRLITHSDSLLKFLTVPGATYHNNRAERQIRPVVIFRKISFGNRTEDGAHRHADLISVVETLRLQQRILSDFLAHIPLADARMMTSLAAQLINSS